MLSQYSIMQNSFHTIYVSFYKKHTCNTHPHSHTDTHTFVHKHTHTHAHTCTHSPIRTHTHTHTHTLSLYFFSLSLFYSLSLFHTHAHTHTHTHAHIHTHIHKHIDPKLRWDDKQWSIDTLTFIHDTIWKPDTKIYEQMEGEFPAQVFPCHKYMNESCHKCMNDSCHTCGMSFVTRVYERITSHKLFTASILRTSFPRQTEQAW